jgi:DNA-binding transcriptional MerR regulator/methylmalonyl-CoA mutase cobalamin-binding subunit
MQNLVDLCLLYVEYKSVADIQHTIKSVSRRTGLSTHVIRVWEKRYGAVKPQRTGTNRRLYTEDEVERLELLHRATKAGHNIGQAAKLPTEKLREILLQVAAAPSIPLIDASVEEKSDAFLVAKCLAAVRQLDPAALDSVLEQGMIRLGQMGFLSRLVAPLSQQVGELWRTGEFTAAHEHFLSAALRTLLGQSVRQFVLPDSAAGIVVGTPAGQLHELGAVMVAAMAANLGWRVTYLGTSLPAAEIAGAAIQNRARAVALSLVYPEDDTGLAGELTNLRRYLPPEVMILAGGRAAPAYANALNAIGAMRVADLNALAGTLEGLRKRSA